MRKKTTKSAGAVLEKYTAERKAEFLLSNSIGKSEYHKIRREVRKMGLDPDLIPHVPNWGKPGLK